MAVFKIKTPLFNYWRKYGWKEGTLGLGLEKCSVDKAAEKDKTLIVYYWKFQNKYTVKAKTVQKYPIERIKGGSTEVYIIPTTILSRDTTENPYERANRLFKNNPAEFYRRYG
jgi:hypothetical protein